MEPSTLISMRIFWMELWILLISFTAQGRGPSRFPLQPWWAEASLRWDTFRSTSNYDSTGKPVSLPSANSFWENSSVEFEGKYTLSPSWGMTIGIRSFQAQANVGQNTKFGGGSLESFLLGANYRWNLSHTTILLLEATSQISLIPVDMTSSDLLYGDGAHKWGMAIGFATNTGPILFSGKMGFLYRTEGLSGLLPYQLGVANRMGDFVMELEFDGFASVLEDQESESYRQSSLLRKNAGSFKYRSANPDSTSLNASLQWNLTPQFALSGGGGSTLAGKNSSQGSHFFLGLDVLWQVFQQQVETSPFKNAIPSKVYRKPNQSFD